ncbi:SulP family inorganic anion transporter [Cesiribacter sp. SM1]|uniref:SulP family inorganic anion transporter n=1 Tax=Cesiribacter sp. SM1 TaxID=2861196 RepID=UPI001CD44785|nr:SulP family inorganic anion transporter [Cesiribacter sp. SM1]
MANKLKSEITFKWLGSDVSAGLVVFLVALPLCLGIALASGAPLFSGIITGIVGGVVVALLSGTNLAVSGPAAGLTVIVLNGIEDLGGWEPFLVAVVLGGVIQLALGFLKAGFIGMFFPHSVIKGLLAAIGLILILKQIPHFFGVDEDFFGDFAFWQANGLNTFSEIFYSLTHIHYGVVTVGIVALAIIIFWDRPFMKQNAILKNIPGALVAVIAAIGLKLFFDGMPGWQIEESHLVSLPVLRNWGEIKSSLSHPDFAILSNPQVYLVALSLGLIASIETLLSVGATDKLDPLRRHSPMNRELLAQGAGNIVSGFIGGLPMTVVIVRSTANISAGGRTKLASFFHGIFLLVSVLAIPGLLTQIPLAALAAVLLVVGYKLVSIKVIREQWSQGRDQFIPFIVTLVAIVLTDLLIGVVIGMVVGMYSILRENYKHAFHKKSVHHNGHETVELVLSEQVTFLNRAHIINELNAIPENGSVVINGSHSTFIDHDVLETIKDFKREAAEKKIDVKLINIEADGGNIQK